MMLITVDVILPSRAMIRETSRCIVVIIIVVDDNDDMIIKRCDNGTRIFLPFRRSDGKTEASPCNWVSRRRRR